MGSLRRNPGRDRMAHSCLGIWPSVLLLALSYGSAAAQPAVGPAVPVPAAAAPEPAAPEPAAAAAPVAAAPVASLPLSTGFRWGGYIKLDGLYSSASRGRSSDVVDYMLVPGAIPVSDSGGGSFGMSARESRLWFETSTPTARGDIGTYIEIDFLGFDASLGNEITSNSSSLRLRHAHGTWRGFLAGQSWSTWMDVQALPEVNDLGSPAGRIFARQGQVRYTRKMPSFGGELQLAAENPETTLSVAVPGDAAQGAQIVPADDRMPDMVAKLVKAGDWGHVAAAGILRLIRSDGALVASVTDSQLGAGAHLSGKLMLGRKHNLRFDASFGRGIGRYIAFGAFRDGQIDAGGKITLVHVVAGILAGQVWLTDTVRINVAGSMSQALDNADLFATAADAASSVNKRFVTVHANVMWNPARSVRLGIEHIFVRRTLENESLTGDMHRIQAAAVYHF